MMEKYEKKIKIYKYFCEQYSIKCSDLLKNIIIYIYDLLKKNNKISSEYLTRCSIIYHNIYNNDVSLILYAYKYIIPYYEET